MESWQAGMSYDVPAAVEFRPAALAHRVARFAQPLRLAGRSFSSTRRNRSGQPPRSVEDPRNKAVMRRSAGTSKSADFGFGDQSTVVWVSD